MDALKISFKFSITYTEKDKKDEKFAEISIEGELILAVPKDESKNILKSWKKKELPAGIQISLFNLIIRKCTPKTVYLAEELSLPLPIQIPKIKPVAKKD